MVAESKIVNARKHSVNDTVHVQVKEGQKTFSGTVAAVGNRTDIEKQLSEIERNKAQGKC